MNFIKNKEKKQFYQLLKKVLIFNFTNFSNTLRQNKIQILLKMNMFSIQQIWTSKFSDTIWHPFQPDGSKCWHWHMLIKCVFRHIIFIYISWNVIRSMCYTMIVESCQKPICFQYTLSIQCSSYLRRHESTKKQRLKCIREKHWHISVRQLHNLHTKIALVCSNLLNWIISSFFIHIRSLKRFLYWTQIYWKQNNGNSRIRKTNHWRSLRKQRAF